MSYRGIVFLVAGLLTAQDYDLIIRNARVIDGTGAPWRRADVAVSNGRIAAVGSLSGSTARRAIDASGRVLAPGFIDVHTHAERREFRPGIEDLPDALNFVRDGVTTIVTGNCGNSATDLRRWFQARTESGIGPNLASLVGHGSVRRAVMESEDRRPTSDEMKRMQNLVEQGMRDGALGMSTGLIYVPGTYAETAEIVALAKTVAKYGGIYVSHVRDEAAGVSASVSEAADVGLQAGLPVEVSHLKIASKRLWGQSGSLLTLIDGFRRAGVDISVDQYPYDQASTQLDTTLPAWALAGGVAKLKERLAEPALHSKIAAEMKSTLVAQGFSDYSYATVASCDFDRSLEGKTISELNRLRGRSSTIENEIETIFDLVSRGTMQMVLHWMSETDVERILKHPDTAVASDGYIIRYGEGVPHPRSYGTRARVLATYVRDKKIVSLEDAIRRMTSLPARSLGFQNRGLVKVGFAADMVLFDPLTVQEASTFAEPHQYSKGFDYVFINGVAVIDNGQHTKKRAGQILLQKPNYRNVP
jgi:N-acyl-D-amino-acid deacylase